MAVSDNINKWLRKFEDQNQFPWSRESPDPSNIAPDAILIDPIPNSLMLNDSNFVYKGHTDLDGLFHGWGEVHFSNGDILYCDFEHGIRNGDAVIVSHRNDISRLCGTYVKGRLNGLAKLVTTDTTVVDCFLKDGAMHGLVRKMQLKKFREFRTQLSYLGRYRSGKPYGRCWKYQEGGGYLYGAADSNGDLSGKDWAYIYPDFLNCWVGEFKQGAMISGQASKIQKALETKDSIMKLTFGPVQGPPVRRHLATTTSMGQDPLVPDPYESCSVVCKSSLIGETAGEGLFSLRSVPKGTVLAFYNGVRIPYKLGGPKEVWETSGYKIFINADYTSGERMDIPAEFISRDKYRATLGHKVNHSFKPNCREWFYNHPRFGVIPSIVAKRQIEAGEELLLDYEYDPYNCPQWFLAALKNELLQGLNNGDDDIDEINPKYRRFAEAEIGTSITNSGFWKVI